MSGQRNKDRLTVELRVNPIGGPELDAVNRDVAAPRSRLGVLHSWSCCHQLEQVWAALLIVCRTCICLGSNDFGSEVVEAACELDALTEEPTGLSFESNLHHDTQWHVSRTRSVHILAAVSHRNCSVYPSGSIAATHLPRGMEPNNNQSVVVDCVYIAVQLHVNEIHDIIHLFSECC